MKQKLILINYQVMKLTNIKRIMIVLIIISSTCMGCGSSGNIGADKTREYYLARSLYYNGESDNALASLERIYGDAPAYVESSRLYARVLYYSGQEEKAILLWEEILEYGICYIDVTIHLSRIYLSEDRFEEAEALIKEGLSVSPEDPTLLYLLADSRSRQGKLSEALVLLGRAEVLMERQCEIYLRQAEIYQSYGFYDESLLAVNKCENLLNDDHPLQNAVKSLKKQLKLN